MNDEWKPAKTKHFGYGEYENAENEVKQSTWFMRHSFLKALVHARKEWVNDLLRIANHKTLSPEQQDVFRSDYGLFIFYTSLFGHNPQNLNFDAELFDTPLRAFFKYLEKKKDQINEIKEQFKNKFNITNWHNSEKLSYRKCIPDWKTLKADSDADHLCSLIEKWAEEYNLTDDWCLDFVLMILINFKINLSYDLENLSLLPETDYEFKLRKRTLEYHIYESLNKALYDFQQEKILDEMWGWIILNFPHLFLSMKILSFLRSLGLQTHKKEVNLLKKPSQKLKGLRQS